MLGSSLWEATGQRELILKQDLFLGEGASSLHPVSKRLATPVVLRGSGGGGRGRKDQEAVPDSS